MSATTPTDYAPLVLAVARRLHVGCWPYADGKVRPITWHGLQRRMWRPDTDPRDSMDLRQRMYERNYWWSVLRYDGPNVTAMFHDRNQNRAFTAENPDELIAVLVAAGLALLPAA